MDPTLFEADIRAHAQYEVLTWSNVKDDWTPQKGVRRGPYSMWGLRRALRKLRGMGYVAGDLSVQVTRVAAKGVA